jgi:dTDP-glucose pyrophosphorylase
MTLPLNIVVPMAGRGSRFANAGYTDPKPLISLGGRPMIQWVIENITPDRAHRFHFICLSEHLERYPEVPAKLLELCPGAEIIPVNKVTEGAACTVLLARDSIDSEAPLMIANSDQIVDLPIDDYLAAGDAPDVSGLIMTFWSDDPKWSFCAMREDRTVSKVVEKEVISNEATVGIYNFAKGRDFVRAADLMIKRNLRVKGEFYVAPCYNQLIEEGENVVVARTGKEREGMYGLGIPADLDFFKTTEYFRKQG